MSEGKSEHNCGEEERLFFFNGESVKLDANEARCIVFCGKKFLYNSLCMFYKVDDKVSARS